MNFAEDAYRMPTGMLLHESGRQFAMAEIVRDSLQKVLYERGGWFLLLVWAERTLGVEVPGAKNAKELPPSVLLNARDDAGITAVSVAGSAADGLAVSDRTAESPGKRSDAGSEDTPPAVLRLSGQQGSNGGSVVAAGVGGDVASTRTDTAGIDDGGDTARPADASDGILAHADDGPVGVEVPRG